MAVNYTPWGGGDSFDPVVANAKLQQLDDAIEDIKDGTAALSAPDVTSFASAQHDHEDAAGGGQITADAIDSTGANDGDVLTSDGAGGTAFETPPPAVITTKGDIMVGDAGGSPDRLAVSATDYLPLVADSAQASGIKWGGAEAIGFALYCARVYNTSNQVVGASGSYNTLTWDSEHFDTHAFHSTVSNTSRFTAPVTGRYRVSGFLGFTAAGGSNIINCKMQKNGVDYCNWSTLISVGASVGTGVPITNVLLDLTAGQYLELLITASTATAAYVIGGATGANAAWWQIELAGV